MLKTASSVINAIGALNYAGTWNASTNNPTLTSGVGTKGNYYVVSVAGTTTLDGISLWSVGDWAVFSGTAWQKVDGSSSEAFSNITVTGLTGYMYANNTSPVTASTTISNAGLANSSLTVNGTSIALGGSGTITAANPNALTVSTGLQLNSGTTYDGSSAKTISIASTTVTAASYGNASTVATFTVNAQGQLTAAGNSTISIAPSQINATIPNSGLTNSTATLGNATITLGSATSTVGNLTLNNVTINSGNVTANLATSTSIPVANATGTLATTNGGTGLTSFTANTIVYANTTSSLKTGTELQFNGTNLTLKGATIGGNTYTTGNVSLDSAQIFNSAATGVFGLDPAFSVSPFKTSGFVTAIKVTATRQAGLLVYGGTWASNAGACFSGVALILADGNGVNVTNISQNNTGGYGNPTISTSGYDITITNPGGASGSIQGCFIGSTVA